jgi:hypothetical protein
MKIAVRVVDCRVEIRTLDLPNTKQAGMLITMLQHFLTYLHVVLTFPFISLLLLP